jgi:hypothetical protein
MPEADLIGRMRFAREGGVVSQKGHGRGAAIATPRDGAVLLLAPFVAKYWTEVPDGIRRYGGLVLRAANSIRTLGESCEVPFGLQCKKTPLLDALTTCLERCSIQSGYLPASLRVELSETHPAASITLMTPNKDAITLFFDDPSAKKNEHPPYSIAVEVRGETLCAFLDLFTANAAQRSDGGDPPDTAVGAVA